MVKSVKFRRLRWNSNPAMIGGLMTFFAFLMVVSMILYGFSEGKLLIFLITAGMGGPYVWHLFQTVCITPENIEIKIAGITLRRIPVTQIRTIVGISGIPEKGKGFGERLVVLSTRSAEYLQNYGGAVLDSNPYLRRALTNTGWKRENPALKINLYFYRHIHFGLLMKPEEGVWLSATDERMEQILKVFPDAQYWAAWGIGAAGL